VIAAALAAAAAACAGAGWAPDVGAAERYALTRRHGLVSFSVRHGARAWHVRPDRVSRTASVMKVVMLATELRRRRDAPVPARIRRDLEVMVRRSDDAAADRARLRLGDAALERTARVAGMTRFRVGRLWGETTFTARDGSRLAAALPGLLPPRHRAYGLRLLQTVVPSQRWGVARVVPRGWTLHFKGGWGSGTGAVDHQVALLTKEGCAPVALAILTTDAPSHGHGKATLEGVARRLLRGL
jgi:hypothetical protein